MHESPTQAWTVAQLAKESALSRSAFFERFSRTVGVAPMEYLLAWRMALAKNLLRRKEGGVAEIAERVGYRLREHVQRRVHPLCRTAANALCAGADGIATSVTYAAGAARESIIHRSAVHHRHDPISVALARDLCRIQRGVERLHVCGLELNVPSGHVLFEIVPMLGAGDGHDVVALL
jgi:hypothetical protein